MEEKKTPNHNEVTTPQEQKAQWTRLSRRDKKGSGTSSGSSSSEGDVQEVGSSKGSGKGSSSSGEDAFRTAGNGTSKVRTQVKKESLSEDSSSDEAILSSSSSDEEEDNSRKTSSGGKKVGQAGSKSGKHPQKRNFAEPAQLNINVNAEKFQPPAKKKSSMLREMQEQSEEERLRAQEEEEEIEEIVDARWEGVIQKFNLQPVSYSSHVYTWRTEKFDPPSGNGLQFWQGNDQKGQGIFTSATSKGVRDKHNIYRSVVAFDCKVYFHYKVDNKDRTKIFRLKQIATEITQKNGFPRLAQDSEYDCTGWTIWHKQTQYPLPPLRKIKKIDDAMANGTQPKTTDMLFIYLAVNLFLTLLEDRVDTRLDDWHFGWDAYKQMEEDKLVTSMFSDTSEKIFKMQFVPQKQHTFRLFTTDLLIMYAYICCIYNCFEDDRNRLTNPGYDLFIRIAQHPEATKEMAEQVLSIAWTGFNTAWCQAREASQKRDKALSENNKKLAKKLAKTYTTQFDIFVEAAQVFITTAITHTKPNKAFRLNKNQVLSERFNFEWPPKQHIILKWEKDEPIYFYQEVADTTFWQVRNTASESEDIELFNDQATEIWDGMVDVIENWANTSGLRKSFIITTHWSYKMLMQSKYTKDKKLRAWRKQFYTVDQMSLEEKKLALINVHLADFKPKLVKIMREINEKYDNGRVVHFPTGVFSKFTERVLDTTQDFCSMDFSEKPKEMVQFLEKIEEYINEMDKKSQENEDHQILDTYCYLFQDSKKPKTFIHNMKKQFQKQLEE